MEDNFKTGGEIPLMTIDLGEKTSLVPCFFFFFLWTIFLLTSPFSWYEKNIWPQELLLVAPHPQLGKNWGPISPVWGTLWITLMAGENLSGVGGEVDIRKEGMAPCVFEWVHKATPHKLLLYNYHWAWVIRSRGDIIITSLILLVNFCQKIEIF
jgi:hypothetical protein